MGAVALLVGTPLATFGLTENMENAINFYEACESGKGWDVCKEFAAGAGEFSCQACDALPGPPITACKTLEDYTNWMAGVCENFGEKATTIPTPSPLTLIPTPLFSSQHLEGFHITFTQSPQMVPKSPA